MRAILLLVLVCVCAQSRAQGTCGDCNGDMTVTILDALLAAQHGAGILTITSPNFELCNVTGTLGPAPGVVDVLDALTLAQYAAGLLVTLPCNLAPECTITAPTGGSFNADVPVDLDTADPLGDPLELSFQFSTDTGATWTPCAAAGSSPMANPSAPMPPAAGLRFVWDALGDVPAAMRPATAVVRAEAFDGQLTSQCESGAFDLAGSSWLVMNDGSGLVQVAELDPGGVPGAFSPHPLPGSNRPFFGAAPSTGDHIYVTDLDAGLHMLDFDRVTGAVTPLPGSPMSLGGFASRMIAIDPTDSFLYVARSSEVRGFAIQPGGAVAALPGSPWSTGTNPGDIVVSGAGDRLYVCSWGSDSISGFDLDPMSGALSAIGGSPWLVGNPAGDSDAVAFASTDRLYCLSTPWASGPASVGGFDIGAGGALTPFVSGPWPTGGTARGGYSSSPMTGRGDLLFAGHSESGGVSALVAAPAGDLTVAPGSPFATLGGVYWLALHPTLPVLYATSTSPGGIDAFEFDPVTGVLTPLPGSPYVVGAIPRGVFVVP